MTNNLPNTSISKIARIAGLAYVLIIVDALLTSIFVDPNYGSADIAATIDNIKANEIFFRIGIAADIIMFILVVALSVALYLILKTIDENLAMFALFFRFGEGIIGAMLILSAVKIFLPNLPDIISVVLFTPGALFELIFGLWLFFKGVNVHQRDNNVPEHL